MTRSSLARRRFLQVGLLAPFAVTAAGLAVQLIALPAVPDPVAVHWGSAGTPDGFGPAWTFPVLTVVIGAGLPALMVGLAAIGDRAGASGGKPAYRLLGTISLAASAFLVVLMTVLLGAQMGLPDAAAAPTAFGPLLAALAAALVVGVLGWVLQPTSEQVDLDGATVEPLVLAPGEQATWTRTAAMSAGALWFLIAAVVLVLGMGVALVLVPADAAAAGWISIAVGVLLALVVGSSTVFRVTVDVSGLTVCSVLGAPWVHVPAAEVAAVGVVQVNPMGEFGGWGLRWAPPRFGVVLRTGEGLEVTRTGGRRFVVTVDDAQTAAALLATVAERARVAKE